LVDLESSKVGTAATFEGIPLSLASNKMLKPDQNDSVGTLLGFSQVKLGSLAGLVSGPSERCSEVFSGTGTAKVTNALLEIAIFERRGLLYKLRA